MPADRTTMLQPDMKLTRINLTVLAALLLAACTPKNTAFVLDERHYSDSTAHADLTMNVELPAADGAAARAMRATLVEMMDQSLSHADTYEEERAFPRFSGDESDTDALMEYYRERTLRHLGNLSQSDFEDRARAIRESPGLSRAEKERLIAEAPKWSYDFNLKQIVDTDRYLVFSSQDYMYMGGAHGGIIGAGFPTFDRQDGHQVTPVLRPDCVEDIQPLLVRGLIGYFGENGMEVNEETLFEILQLDEEEHIPLPTWDPYPGEDGLVFTYQQYEIASYAAGMPGFVVPFGEVKEFLSADAVKVFGL